VKKFPILYGKSKGGHINISVTYGITYLKVLMPIWFAVDSCQRRWKSLRDRFTIWNTTNVIIFHGAVKLQRNLIGIFSAFVVFKRKYQLLKTIGNYLPEIEQKTFEYEETSSVLMETETSENSPRLRRKFYV